jgi:hypothetical protein
VVSLIEPIVEALFNELDKTWTVVASDGTKRQIHPDETDIQTVLDEAVKNLYTGEIGDRFSVGGLIIEKQLIGYDVYAYVGNYI